MKRRWKMLLATVALILAAAGAVAGLFVAAANVLVIATTRARTYDDAHVIPTNRVALVLGCSQYLGGGRRNLFFAYRMDAAVELLQEGRVEYILVSGDNHTRAYDEATAMQRALFARGVPAEKVFVDYAGFRTLDSVVRARKVFGQTSLTVVSQEFHNYRALYICRHEGIDAVAYNAKPVRIAGSFRTRLREYAARVVVLLDLHVTGRGPKFLGEPVRIGEGARPK